MQNSLRVLSFERNTTAVKVVAVNTKEAKFDV